MTRKREAERKRTRIKPRKNKTYIRMSRNR